MKYVGTYRLYKLLRIEEEAFKAESVCVRIL